MTEAEFASFVGKNIKIEFADGESLEGKCFYYTQALDNEPEIASMSVQTHDRGAIEVYQNEVKSIEITD